MMNNLTPRFYFIFAISMLNSNLWVEANFLNDSLGNDVAILYNPNYSPPSFPSFDVVDFLHYKGVKRYYSNPKYVTIPPIKMGFVRNSYLAWKRV